jgi:hypothetical protein
MLNPTWGSASPDSMQRLTARFLLLMALVGTFVPLAMQGKAASAHACCRRQATHHCHDSAETNPNQSVASRTGCCNHDCCHAVTSAQWAHPLPSSAAASVQDAAAREIGDEADHPLSICSSFLHSRAPPAPLLA